MPLMETLAHHYVLACSANADDTSFSALAPTTTEPTGAGVIDVTRFTNPGNLEILFFGTDADNETFDARLFRWKKIGTMWVPTNLVTVSATLSSSLPSAAETPNTTSDYFADTLVFSTSYNGDNSVQITNGISDMAVASLFVNARGAQKIQIMFDLTGAASANALVSGY